MHKKCEIAVENEPDRVGQWVIRIDEQKFAACNVEDDPENPIFWVIVGHDDPEDHSDYPQRQVCADLYRFASRIR